MDKFSLSQLELIKQQYVDFLRLKGELSDEEIDKLESQSVSLFIGNSDFDEFVEKEYKDSSSIFNIEDNDSAQNLGDEYEFTSKTEDKSSVNIDDKAEDTGFNYLKDINKNITDNDLKIISGLFDKDKNGSISQSESNQARKFLGLIDSSDENLTENDLKIFKDYVDKLSGFGLNQDQIISKIFSIDKINDDLSEDDFKFMQNDLLNGDYIKSLQEAKDMGIADNSSLQEGGDSVDGGGGGGTAGKGKFAAPMLEKNFQNMSIDELEEELKKSEEDKQKSLETLTKETEKIDAELSKKITELNQSITDKQSEIDTANKELADNTDKYNTASDNLDAANDRVDEISSSIDELSSLLSSLSSSENDSNDKNDKNDKESKIDPAEIQRQIDELTTEKEDLENNKIPAYKKEMDDAKAVMDKLSGETIPKLNEELEKYTEDLAKSEQEVRNLSESHPELEMCLEAYDEACEYNDQVKQTLEIRKADKERAENTDMVDIDMGSRDYRDLDEYDFKNLPMTFTLDGKTYHLPKISGIDVDSYEELQRYIANAGLANIGQYGNMQCQNYSNIYVDLILGTTNPELLDMIKQETEDPSFGDQDKAGLMAHYKEYNQRHCQLVKAKDRDEGREIIENELQNGRPCIVSIPTKDGGTHYGVAVGLADTGEILIMDSYDAAMKRLGKSSNTDENSEWRNLATGNNVMVFIDGSRFDNKTYKAMDYDDIVNKTSSYSRARSTR